MKVLIIGNGGREHALAWKVARDSNVTHVYVAPGNAGTASEHNVSNVNIDVLAIPELVAFAQQEKIDLTIVGPEAPLVAGVVDQFAGPQPSLRAPRPSVRTFWPGTTSPPLPTRTSLMLRRPKPTCASREHRL